MKILLVLMVGWSMYTHARIIPDPNEPHKECIFHGEVVDIVFPYEECDFSPYYDVDPHPGDDFGKDDPPVNDGDPHDPDCFREEFYYPIN